MMSGLSRTHCDPLSRYRCSGDHVVTIGRAARSTIHIPDDRVSKAHACIELVPGVGFTIKDVGR